MKNEYDNSSPSILTMLLLVLILVSAGVIILKDKNQIEELKQKQVTLFENLEIRDSLINDMLTTFDKVEQNLAFLREKRGEIIPVSHNNSRNRQEMLVADVVLLNRMLNTSSQNFNQLEKSKNTSYFEIELLKNELELLYKIIEANKTEIQKLKEQVVQHDSEFIKPEMQDKDFHSETYLTSTSFETKGEISTEKTLENSIKR